MKELYNTMRQDHLLTTTNTTSVITPPPQLTGSKAARGILGVCALLILSLVMGACGSSEDTDDTKPTKPDTTTPTDKEETVTVTFALNYKEATDTPPVSQTIKKDNKATKPADPTRTGYTFVDWYTDTATKNVFAFTTPITGDMTLYAGWTAIITYTVTFDLGGGTGDAPNQTINKDNKATKPADPTRDDYTFDDWYTDAATTKAFVFDTTPITADITLYARWVKCPAREARKALTHVVPLYNGGKADAPYLPQKLLGNFADGSGEFLYILNRITVPDGKDNQLPYIDPLSYVPADQGVQIINTGGFEITPDYIDASFTDNLNGRLNSTVRISCYSVKEVEENLYFYYGKVRFLFGGQETEAFNKTMYAWTGIDKRDPANKDALYGYMVSIQGDYLRALKIYPFVGGIYTADGKTVTFPKTEADYAALTLEDLNIIATAPLTSELLFAGFNRPAGIYGID